MVRYAEVRDAWGEEISRYLYEDWHAISALLLDDQLLDLLKRREGF